MYNNKKYWWWMVRKRRFGPGGNASGVQRSAMVELLRFLSGGHLSLWSPLKNEKTGFGKFGHFKIFNT